MFPELRPVDGDDHPSAAAMLAVRDKLMRLGQAGAPALFGDSCHDLLAARRRAPGAAHPRAELQEPIAGVAALTPCKRTPARRLVSASRAG